VIILVGVILWAAFAFGLFYGHGRKGLLATVLEIFSMHWMTMIFLGLVCFLAVDIITLFGLLFPRVVPVLRSAALISTILLSVIALVQGLRAPGIQNYEVRLESLPAEMDGTVLVALSDLHLGSVLGEDWLEKRVAQVQELQPDIVVVLGDTFEGHGQSQEGIIPVLRRLSAPLGVWAVLGNHAFYGNLETTTSLIKKAGFELLRNSWKEIKPGFVIAGTDDLSFSRRRKQVGDPVSETLSNRPKGATILLSHSPREIDKAAENGVGLMLCGHTHAGQVWPFGYLVRCFYPFVEGRHEVGNMSVIVCRGTGTWGPRMRLWRRGEMLRIVLRSKD